MDPLDLSPPPHHSTVQHFIGYVETTTDALRLIMAARQGIIPRITRRLNDSERRSMIRSGSVFVFCVEESGIKRWTEGLSWSPSRIIGNFLVYREVTERGNGRGGDRRPPAAALPPLQGSSLSSSLQRYRSRSEAGATRSADGVASLRPNGLIKKTITVRVESTDHHLVSYYREDDVRVGLLQRPTCRPDIMELSIPPEMVRATNFRHPPHIERGPDGSAHIYDAEEADYQRRQQNRASSASTSSSPYSPTSPIALSTSISDIPQPEIHSSEGAPSPIRLSRPSHPVKQEPNVELYDHSHAVARSTTTRQGCHWTPTSLPPLNLDRQQIPSTDDRTAGRDSRASWQQKACDSQQMPSLYYSDTMYAATSPSRDATASPVISRSYARPEYASHSGATGSIPGVHERHTPTAWSAPSNVTMYQQEVPYSSSARTPTGSLWDQSLPQSSTSSYQEHRHVPRQSDGYYTQNPLY